MRKGGHTTHDMYLNDQPFLYRVEKVQPTAFYIFVSVCVQVGYTLVFFIQTSNVTRFSVA